MVNPSPNRAQDEVMAVQSCSNTPTSGSIGLRTYVHMIFILASIALPASISAQTKQSKFDEVVMNASAAREQNDVPRAIELYTEAVRLNPKWPDGWWFLGLL